MKAALAASTLGALALFAACGKTSEAVHADGETTNASVTARASTAPVPAATTPSATTPAPSGSPPPIASPAPPTSPASSTPAPSTTRAPRVQTVSALRPEIHAWPIPFGAARKREMAAYSLRHYGEDTYVLSDPKVIVEHYTETATAQEAYDTFAPDVPDSEFGELPNTCAHFLVEPSGRIDELVPLTLRCRHTVGLNWTAIGIENVGMSDAQVLDDRAQIAASLRLTRWLRCRYGISLNNVIGHNESLSSPYHHDRVPAFQHQTHSDFNHADMHVYRTRLARLGSCSGG